jgi:hypothetical protein
MRKSSLLIALVAALAAVAFAAAPTAGAYGSTAVYQVTFSLNCTNPTPGACDQFGGPGGVWGWIEFDSDHTGDMTVTVCGHTVGGGGPGGAGAGHANVDISSWSTSGGLFSIDASTPVLPPFLSGTALEIPAAPGHYSGHPFPGLAEEITVVQIPGRTA